MGRRTHSMLEKVLIDIKMENIIQQLSPALVLEIYLLQKSNNNLKHLFDE